MTKKLSAALLLLAVASLEARPQSGPQDGGTFFRSSVDLVNVTATVTDTEGHFVTGLTRDDFRVYDNDVLQTITNFGTDRVPVSLGIVLDTSSSMEGSKIRAARTALEQFLDALNDSADEFFLYTFDEAPHLLQEWTRDRRQISRALVRAQPDGGTAMFDAVADAVPMLAKARNQKKALVIVSDGNDTSRQTRPERVQQLIRQYDALVYAIGIDGPSQDPGTISIPVTPPRGPEPGPGIPRLPVPAPPSGPRWPGGVLRSAQWQWPGQQPQPKPLPARGSPDDRVNAAALRSLTDDSGGRTEIVRSTIDLRPATLNIANELSRQYSLAFPAPETKDGRWHAIRVDVTVPGLRVRARRGYTAS